MSEHQGRIARAFANARADGRAAFVVFLSAGHPTLERTVELVLALERAGVDVVELGVPFSDPVIDGPIIQLASKRALAAGATLPGILDVVRAIRRRSQIALVLYSYLNPLLRYGIDRLVQDAAAAGIDGMLTIDLDLEAGGPILDLYGAARLDPIVLIAPTTASSRHSAIVQRGGGFIYLMALTGRTGVKDAEASQAAPRITELRPLTDLPIAAGVGIKTPRQVAEFGRIADGVVVGSALVQLIDEQRDQPDMIAKVEQFARELVSALPRRS